MTGTHRVAPGGTVRSFLRDDDLTPAEQSAVLAVAARLKADPYAAKPLAGPRSVGLVFDKPTLRTQTSFSAGVAELGGYPSVIDGRLAGIGERESIADVARVLGGQLSMLVWRTYDQARLEEMAAVSGIPVVNALSDQFHPCQVLADLQTVAEHRGGTAGQVVTFLGDGACNMAHSWLLGGAAAGVHLRVSSPAGYEPDDGVLATAARIAEGTGGSVAFVADAAAAADGADVLMTDTWVSMGREAEAGARSRAFADHVLDEAALGWARDDAVVMHCLPAYRGKEISAAVLDGPRSVIWDQAENRRHAQKALLWFLAHQAGWTGDWPGDAGPDEGPR